MTPVAPVVTCTPVQLATQPQVKLEPLPVTQTSPLVASPREPMPMASTMFAERKMKSSKNKKSSKNRGLNLTSTKDLGRWKPVDDLALIIGVQQTNDLKMVHRGTKFSCKFTLNELQNRWYSLLYEEAVSRIAVAAMRNLHPELVENIQSKALYTAQEEEVLATIKSVRYI